MTEHEFENHPLTVYYSCVERNPELLPQLTSLLYAQPYYGLPIMWFYLARAASLAGEQVLCYEWMRMLQNRTSDYLRRVVDMELQAMQGTETCVVAGDMQAALQKSGVEGDLQRGRAAMEEVQRIASRHGDEFLDDFVQRLTSHVDGLLRVMGVAS